MSYEESENGWIMHPIDGETGMAYMGTKNEEKIFLKKNSSPFLAALSILGITPRLKWTKRLNNGDILSAQEWLNGRCLERSEMADAQVAHIIKEVHESERLLQILRKVGGQEVYPQDFIKNLNQLGIKEAFDHSLIQDQYIYLEENLSKLDIHNFSVCHGDMSRKNWMLSEQNRIYLVDWDNALISDPIFDVASILYHYIEPSKWSDWLSHYGIVETEDLKSRLKWYGSYAILLTILKAKDQREMDRYDDGLKLLRSLNTYIG